MLLLIFTCLSVMAGTIGKSQKDTINIHNKNFIYNIKKTNSPVIIDGVLEESVWEQAQKATDFYLVLPVDSGFARQQSEVMMTYDDKALYMAVVFYDTVKGKRIMESFRRDFNFGNNDNFLVFFDTYLDQTTGFSFGISASGAKWDGTMSDGSEVHKDWDCKWESETRHYDDRWISEMRIPFKSIRYPSDGRMWYVNFGRLDLKTDEKSSWAPVPRQFPTASLAYTGILRFDEPLPESKIQFSLIPYLYGGYSKDYESDGDAVYDKDFGFDAKIGISSSMNLDLTYNPDFAQVEVDQQVTNIDRFELFFPEKRQFFLENSDLFAGFGDQNVTPFFSRRIGLDAPVLAGARLSGKLGNDWRIGFMNMTTQKTSENMSRNFTVASVQKKVFSRSNIGFILVNKEYLNQPVNSNLFNRIAGADFNLASKNNFWEGKLFYHRSFQTGNPDKQFSQGARIEYNTQKIQLAMKQLSVGENYIAETGFVRRTGYNYLGPSFTYLFVPNKRVVSHGMTLKFDNYFDPEYHKIEHENRYSYQFVFKNRANFSLGYRDIFIELQEDFDPTHITGKYLPAGSRFRFGNGFINYNSTVKTIFTWSAEAATGNFYNGDIRYIKGKIGYRYQPWINFMMNIDYTSLNLPQPFERTSLWLIGPKMDITFTDKIFLTTFVQYNEQADNMNVNMRFQWRYKPVSDIFLVYTDNYLPETWNSRHRAIVLKITYWLN